MAYSTQDEGGKEYVVKSWHLDPKVTVSALVTAIAALVGVASFVIALGSGIEENTKAIDAQSRLFREGLLAERKLSETQLDSAVERMKQTEQRVGQLEQRLEINLKDIQASIDRGFSEVRNDIKTILRDQIDREKN